MNIVKKTKKNANSVQKKGERPSGYEATPAKGFRKKNAKSKKPARGRAKPDNLRKEEKEQVIKFSYKEANNEFYYGYTYYPILLDNLNKSVLIDGHYYQIPNYDKENWYHLVYEESEDEKTQLMEKYDRVFLKMRKLYQYD